MQFLDILPVGTEEKNVPCVTARKSICESDDTEIVVNKYLKLMAPLKSCYLGQNFLST